MKQSRWLLGMAAGVVANLAFSGCGVSSISSCGGLSLDQLKSQNTISSDCLTAIQALLPSASNSITGKIYPLSMVKGSSLVLYAGGLNSSGTAYSTSDFSGATVQATVNGTTTTLTSSEFTVAPVSGANISMSFVTDYSGSMADSDITTAGQMYTDVVNAMQSGIYGDAYIFSSTVTRKQTFTNTKATLLSAVAADLTVARSSTALYDAVGTSVTTLSAQSSPIKIVVVFTDGLENSSTTYTATTAAALVSSSKVYALMIGTLFADSTALQTVAGSRGAFIYAKGISDAKTALALWTTGANGAVAITLNNAYLNATAVTVKIGSVTGTF